MNTMQSGPATAPEAPGQAAIPAQWEVRQLAGALGAKVRGVALAGLFPGTVPSIFVVMRIGIGIGWMTLVAAEFTGVKEGYGLGYMIMTARDIQRPDEILAGMLVIGIIGLLIDIGLRVSNQRPSNGNEVSF